MQSEILQKGHGNLLPRLQSQSAGPSFAARSRYSLRGFDSFDLSSGLDTFIDFAGSGEVDMQARRPSLAVPFILAGVAVLTIMATK